MVLVDLPGLEAGGFTVIPKLNIAAAPNLGYAVFWHNRKDDGAADGMTLHGTCPVLAGSKWVVDKWSHIRG